ncbi:hypothetical protein Rs2_28858 [Raphanus sativus]|nr:hypothetical protein Rs2_28858 [Raphanus sativus]
MSSSSILNRAKEETNLWFHVNYPVTHKIPPRSKGTRIIPSKNSIRAFPLGYEGSPISITLSQASCSPGNNSALRHWLMMPHIFLQFGKLQQGRLQPVSPEPTDLGPMWRLMAPMAPTPSGQSIRFLKSSRSGSRKGGTTSPLPHASNQLAWFTGSTD